MKRTLIFILGCFVALTAVMPGAPQVYRDRWVYVITRLGTDQELAQVEGIARTASEHGMNGMLLAAGFDQMDWKSSEGPRFVPYSQRKAADLAYRSALRLLPRNPSHLPLTTYRLPRP